MSVARANDLVGSAKVQTTIRERGACHVTTTVEGPMWSAKGLDVASGRYPLRVETHVSQMVDRLLPGVTAVTAHALYFVLHPLVWAEARSRGLDLEDARELLRRCEVVVAGASALHGPHVLPAAHGEDEVAPQLAEQGTLGVARMQEVGRYSSQMIGFSGAYRGSEERLGLLAPEGNRYDRPGERFDERLARQSMNGLFDLAGRDELTTDDLQAAGHLCVCQVGASSAGRKLRSLLCKPEPSPDYRKLDDARAATARILGRILTHGPLVDMEAGFSSAIRHGSLITEDATLAGIPESWVWRGVALRNFTVSAWRRLWSLLVEHLDEPRSQHEVAGLLASEVEDITVRELFESLPDSMSGDIVLDAEGELRGRANRGVDVEVALLALAARRVDELDGPALRAYSPRPQEVLSPHWLKEYFQSRIGDPLPSVVRDLAERLVDRAMRVALSKMQTRSDGSLWIPTRVKERDGILYRVSSEGWGNVGLRVGSFSTVLAGAGVLNWTEDGWILSSKGEALIG